MAFFTSRGSVRPDMSGFSDGQTISTVYRVQDESAPSASIRAQTG